MLAYSDGNPSEHLKSYPEIDREETGRFVADLFPSDELVEIDEGDLSFTCPPDEVLYAGCFDGTKIVAAYEFGLDYPSSLPEAFLSERHGKRVSLHAMHSVVDWFAYAVWENGSLVRSLSLSPDSGVLEDIGEKLAFEVPYWQGEHPVFDPEDEEEEDEYPFCFHPLELGEAALGSIFGYVLEGYNTSEMIEPERIKLLGYRRSRKAKKPWWKFWK